MRYKNKYFREVLEKDLKDKDLGVNIHCKEDGIHITVPPYSPTGDDFTDDYGTQTLREDYDTDLVVNKIKEVSQKRNFHSFSDLEIMFFGFVDQFCIEMSYHILSNSKCYIFG